MEEIWKDIKDYEDIYQVSNTGRVRSLDHYITFYDSKMGHDVTKLIKGRLLKQRIGKLGYDVVILCKSGDRKDKKVHRLVAEAFIPNPNNYPHINHKDEVKHNNSVDNLEWCTQYYNINYGNRNISYSIPIVQLDLNDNIIKEWSSANKASKVLNIPQSCIWDCCNGNINKTHNYKWKYKNEITHS